MQIKTNCSTCCYTLPLSGHHQEISSRHLKSPSWPAPLISQILKIPFPAAAAASPMPYSTNCLVSTAASDGRGPSGIPHILKTLLLLLQMLLLPHPVPLPASLRAVCFLQTRNSSHRQEIHLPYKRNPQFLPQSLSYRLNTHISPYDEVMVSSCSILAAISYSEVSFVTHLCA